jgi:hypothetical protein
MRIGEVFSSQDFGLSPLDSAFGANLNNTKPSVYQQLLSCPYSEGLKIVQLQNGRPSPLLELSPESRVLSPEN